MAGNGADVILVGRATELLDEVAREIEDLGRSGLVVGADMSVEQDERDIATSALDAIGKVDILVNNAATIYPKTRLQSGSPELISVTTAVRDIVSIVDSVDVPISTGLSGPSE